MTYTDCRLHGEPGSWRSFFRRAFNAFVRSMHETGFDCGQIVIPALSDGFGRDCGFKSPSNGQTVFVSRSFDLKTWEPVGDALAGGPSWLRDESIIFRPAVLYSPNTGKYVLWANHLPRVADKPVVESYKVAGFIVGTSDTPEGPFQFAPSMNDARPAMAHAGGADFSLMYDPAGPSGYVAYGSWHNFCAQGKYT